MPKASDIKKLIILGLAYDVEYVPYISRGEFRIGEISYEGQKIRVLDTLPDDRCRQVLLHEMLHGILSGLGMHSLSDYETLVQSLATALHQCIRDNPDLFAISSSEGF